MRAPRRPTATATLAVGLTVALSTAPAQERVSILDVPALARARSERQRPEQLARLAPFLPDLSTEYGRNAEVLDVSIAKAAELGDAVVPLLVEYLSPAEPVGNRERWLAENAGRVLLRLEPAAHVETWIELAEGRHGIARRQALRLLGASGADPRAAAALARVAPRLEEPWDRVVALRAATGLPSDALVPFATANLTAGDAELRAAALDYLTAHPAPAALQPALQALPRETENGLLGRYIELFARLAHGDAAVAAALVPLIAGVRLDPEDLLALVTALATIAPEEHQPTIDALTALIERGETGALGVRAALTLQELGDKRGPRLLFDMLEEHVRDRRSSSAPYADRAEAYFAFGKHREAIRDYEQAIKFSRPGSRQATYWLQIARCEAHRGSLRGMLKAIEESGVSAQTVRAEAAKDAVFLEQIEKDQARRFLDSLGR